MDILKESLQLHRKKKGKIAIKSKVPLKNMADLSLVYTPGVSAACLAIKDNPDEAFNLTSKSNTVAVISDGTAVLGLGDIGPLAAMPVMEGKCIIFKKFANIDAIPLVLNTKDVDEIVDVIKKISPSFGGINLEDIKAPKCFIIEEKLKQTLDIPVFHDDQHGTAIVVGAALINALKLVKKELAEVRIVINGAGSAGIAVTKFLLALGAKNITICDRYGIVYPNDSHLNFAQKEVSLLTNLVKKRGLLKDALQNADVFIGLSVGNVVTKEMIIAMNKDAVVFPLANPVPEITREHALSAGAKIVGTGASNQPNQINNALVFPGLFKGILKAKAKQFSLNMLIKATYALANVVSDDELNENYIIPNIFNENVVKAVSFAVYQAAKS